jgi:dienelactone hydrolase
MKPFCYPPVSPRFNLELKEKNDKWLRYAVDFPVARPTKHKEHNIAFGDYYQPINGDNFPLVILVHGMGDHSTFPCRLLARDLAKRGIASFILYLVFHSSRMPKAIKSKFPNLTEEEWFEGYQSSVIDVRQVLDWATGNSQINKEQIAIIGISLGGMVSAISMGVDKRICAGVLTISGGNYESDTWLRRACPDWTEEQYADAQKAYRRYLAEVAKKGFENVEPPKKTYLTDPMTFASYLRKRPLLMINATLDERIPRQATLDLWEAVGRPEIKWLPGTHASVWLLYSRIRREIINFLNSTFGK